MTLLSVGENIIEIIEQKEGAEGDANARDFAIFGGGRLEEKIWNRNSAIFNLHFKNVCFNFIIFLSHHFRENL